MFFISYQWVPQRSSPFVQFTCAPDVPCRCPEWLPGGEVEGKWSHLRGACALEWPAEPFRDAGEFHEAIRRMATDCKSIASAAFRSQAESAYRQYRVVRWLLLPETELCLRPAANAGFQILRDVNENRRSRLQICWNWNCTGLQINRFCRFPVAGGVGLRQYRVVRWLLLPEAELRLRPAATLDCKSCVT